MMITKWLDRIRALSTAPFRELALDGPQLARELRQVALQWLTDSRHPEQLAVAAGLHRAKAALDFAARIAGVTEQDDVVGALCAAYLAEASLALMRARLCNATAPSRLVPPQEEASPASDTWLTTPSLAGLVDIARTHRAHERYYTQTLCESAAALFRDANRLRVLCEAWENDTRIAAHGLSARYGVLGAHDLNATPAIAAIGVLFMEGEGEPSEIKLIKARLQGTAAAAATAGDWLIQKMVEALARERQLLTMNQPEAARVRFQTIGGNWCGAEESRFTGYLLREALAALDRVDFRPDALRAARNEALQDVSLAAAAMVLAAQQQQQFSSRMADGDLAWTRYLRLLAGGFNVELSVPDFAEYLARYRAASDDTRRRRHGEVDIPYGPHTRERLDVYRAEKADKAPAPAILFIHGGGWRKGDKAERAFPADVFCPTGAAWISLGYPLAGESSLDDMVAAVHRAVHWVSAHANTLGIDANALVLAGNSAGAHLAALAITDDVTSLLLTGAALISGCYDLRQLAAKGAAPWLRLDRTSAARHSPILRAGVRTMPIVCAVGSDEDPAFQRESVLFDAHWRSLGRPSSLVTLPGNHFSILSQLGERDSVLAQAIGHLANLPSELLDDQ